MSQYHWLTERQFVDAIAVAGFAQTHGVYLYLTQSSTGADSSNIAQVPLLGNRIDRYVWNPASETLTPDRNLTMLRSFQADSPNPCCGTVLGQPMRGNHDGGKILFGPYGKLYFQIGDNGRRGQLQNLPRGSFGTGEADDQFGGPAPDNAHLTGVIFRLTRTARTRRIIRSRKSQCSRWPRSTQSARVKLTDGQLAEVGCQHSQGVFARAPQRLRPNICPISGLLWESENGDDAFEN